MPRFIALVEFTPKGVTEIEGSVERSEAIRSSARTIGVEVRDIYWTLGAYDGVLVFDAPDGPTATAFLLSIGKAGNVSTKTLRAFDGAEMKTILGKLG